MFISLEKEFPEFSQSFAGKCLDTGARALRFSALIFFIVTKNPMHICFVSKNSICPHWSEGIRNFITRRFQIFPITYIISRTFSRRIVNGFRSLLLAFFSCLLSFCGTNSCTLLTLNVTPQAYQKEIVSTTKPKQNL